MELIKDFGAMHNVQRIQYPNLESKHKWSDKIILAGRIYPILEHATVAYDIRPAMIDHHVTMDNLSRKARFYASKGLYLLPLNADMLGEGFNHQKPRNGKLYFRSVVTKSKQVAEEFLHYNNERNHIGVGRLLGFPEESCKFFDKIWADGYIDPIWQQAENTLSPVLKNKRDFTNKSGELEKKLIRLKQHDDFYLISGVLRYINIRATSHFSHSFSDEESLVIARQWIQLARDMNLPGVDDLVEIMQLPYQWNCYKGIADVTTPVFKLMVNSMQCYPYHVIQQESDYYPKEAPKGITFPFQFKI